MSLSYFCLKSIDESSETGTALMALAPEDAGLSNSSCTSGMRTLSPLSTKLRDSSESRTRTTTIFGVYEIVKARSTTMRSVTRFEKIASETVDSPACRSQISTTLHYKINKQISVHYIGKM